MATPPRILVESPTFQNQRIGIARTYEGNQTADAIVRGADQLAGLAFRAAAENAQTQATEMAQSISQTDVIAIDPNTGAPVALGQMGNMGRIGSEAYRRVINTRFQQSIEEEIRNQATVLAGQYEDNPDGVALYTEAMSDYIASMSQNATGQWRSFIEDAGTSYLNRTRASLTVAQMRASRARLAESAKRSNAEALSAFEGAISNYGPAAFGEAPPTDTSRPVSIFNPPSDTPSVPTERSGVAGQISQSVRVGLSDSVEADIISPVAMDGWSLAQREAALRGMTTYYINQLDMANPETVTQLSRLRYAIGSGDIVSVMRQAPELAPFANFLLNNAESARDFDTFANRALTDAISLSELESKQYQAEADADALELSLVWAQDAQNAAYRTEATYRDLDPAVITTSVMQAAAELNRVRSSIPGMRNELEREAAQNRITSQTQAIQRGVFDNLVRDLPNQDEVDRMRAAFAARNPNLLTAEERPIYNAITALERFNPEVFADVDKEFGNYRESGGRFAQAEAASVERILIEQEVLPFVNNMLMLRGADIRTTAEEYIQTIQLSADRGLEDGARNAALTAVNTRAAEAYLYQAFEVAQSSEEALALREYAEGTRSSDGLNPNSIAAIDEARSFAGATGNTSTMPTAVGRAVEAANRRITAEQEERNRIEGMNVVASGTGNASVSSHRGYAQNVLEQDYRNALITAARANGQVPQSTQLPPDLLTNPQYLQDPSLRPMFNRLYNTPGYMPDSVYNVFSAIGTGAMVEGMDVALSHWSRMRFIDGMRNPALRSMSEDEVGMLDMMSEAVAYFGAGPDGRVRLEEAMVAHNRLMHSEPFRTQVDNYLGEPLDDFLAGVGGYDTLASDQQAAIRALSSHLISMSITAPQMGSGSRWLRGRLETQINEATPDSGGLVVEFSPNGRMITRTRYPLDSFTSGYTNEFLSMVSEDIRQFSNAPALIGSSAMTAEAQRLAGVTALTSAPISGSRTAPKQYSFLVPLGEDAQGGISYRVYQMNLDTGMMSPVMRTDDGYEGEPLVVSTGEPRFRTLVLGRRLRAGLEQGRRGDAYLNLLGQAMSSGGEGLELMGLPPEMRNTQAGTVDDLSQIPPATYQQWMNMSRSQRRSAGLPVSPIGGNMYYNRFGVGAGFNDPETGLAIRPGAYTRPTAEDITQAASERFEAQGESDGGITYQQWMNMSRSERSRRGLPVSLVGGEMYFNRFGVGLGINNPETGGRK